MKGMKPIQQLTVRLACDLGESLLAQPVIHVVGGILRQPNEPIDTRDTEYKIDVLTGTDMKTGQNGFLVLVLRLRSKRRCDTVAVGVLDSYRLVNAVQKVKEDRNNNLRNAMTFPKLEKGLEF